MANETVLPCGPFVRCVTSVEPHACPPEAASGGANMLVDPISGGMFKRGGNVIVGDTVTGQTKHANAGLLEGTDADPEWIPYRLRQFYSEALADGQQGGAPTHSVLYGRDFENALWPEEDSGIFGTEYVRRPNANYQLLSEYGAAAYPTDGSNGGGAFATGGIPYTVVPFWYESGEGGYSRGAFALARRFVASGSWGTVDAGRWRYYPNLRGTPIRWDGGCNDSSTVIANHVRVYPTGPFAPLWSPTVAANGEAAGGRESGFPWISGDTFYLSVIFQFEDGSYSIPFTPRDINSVLTGGAGFVTVGTIAGAKHYTSLTYSNIPLGPPGTIARLLVRSPKQTRTATTDALTVDMSDLRILGILRNNTSNSYVDTLSNDNGLLQDTDIVRWDLICPPRARHIGTGDQRVIVGYTLPNPVAIMLTATGTSASDYALNTEDTGVAPGTQAALYRVTSTGLELTLASGGAAIDVVTIDWATYDTVQKVVDKINATARDGTGGSENAMWKAQIAPGVDPTAASSGLCPTVLTVANCTGSGTTLTTTVSDGFAPVPVGYKCYAAAGMTAGTYVRSVSSSTAAANALLLSAASTTSNATVTFYADCGDEAAVTTAGSKGWIRVYGPAYPGMVYFKRSALAGYNRPNKDRIYFTISSPGAAATGVSIAANAWGASNRRDGENSPGQVMGIVDIEGAAIIAYRNRIGAFINKRGSNTGEDFDYRILGVNNSQGCISPWSVVKANGCAVYATAVGIKATDRSLRELLISGDLYQPVRGLGDMAYEFPKCVAAAATDSYNCWLGGALWGSRLVYSYRRSAATYGYSVYDFSPGVDHLGLEAIANPDTRQPYGWSAMCYMDYTNDIFGPRAMGAVQTASGLLFYGALNDNAGTNDGRVDQMFTGDQDNGVAIIGTIAGKQYLAGQGTKFSIQSIESTHRVPYSGPVVYSTRQQSGISEGSIPSITSSGSNTVTREDLQVPQVMRSPGTAAQVIWYDDVDSETGGLVHRLDIAVEVLKTVGG